VENNEQPDCKPGSNNRERQDEPPTVTYGKDHRNPECDIGNQCIE